MVNVKNVIGGITFFLVALMVLYVGNAFLTPIINLASYDSGLETIVNGLWAMVQVVLLIVIPVMFIFKE